MRELDQPIKLPDAKDVGYTGAISGAMMQIVYGDFLTEAGTIPCVHFATNGGLYYWLVSGKPMKSIGNIYVEGIMEESATDFTIYEDNNLEGLGNIAYLTTPTDYGYKKISVGGEGRMDDSSSLNLIEVASEVFGQVLVDVAEATIATDFESSSWALTGQRCILQGYKFAGIIRDNNIMVGQLILQMVSEWFGDAWIDKSGKLVTIVDIGTIVEQEIKGTIFQSDLVETSIILTQRLDDVVNNLLMKYKYDFTNQRYLGNKDGNEDPTYKDINSINAYGNVPQRTLMFRWVKDDAHISKIKDVIFTIYAGVPRPYTKLGFRLKDLRHNNIYAGPFVRFSYNKFYKDGVPMENEVIRIKNISKDFNRMIIDITAEDMEVISNV